MVREGNYFSPINISSHSPPQKNPTTQFPPLNKRINVNICVIIYDSKDVVSDLLTSISHNYYNKSSPLHIPMEEQGNIMDEQPK